MIKEKIFITIFIALSTLNFSGCVKTDVTRYAFAWILSLVLGVIFLIIKVLKDD